MNKYNLVGLVVFCLLFTSCVYIGLLNIGVGQSAIKGYKFPNHTKNEIRQSIECLFKNHSIFKVPNTIDSNFLIHKYSSPGTPEFNRWNADSVNFHFFIVSEKDSFLLWTRFSGLMDNWDESETEFGHTGVLVIYGVSINKSGWKQKGDSEFKRSDRRKSIKLFETEILPKINEYLVKPCNLHQ